jgi:uncharacterized membrane protein (Fun14 family)
MWDIGQWFYDTLSPLGLAGLLFCIFLLFYIDAIVFPTLPELFVIIIFSVNPTVEFAVAILITIAVAEVLGLATLYILVKKVGVPRVIDKALKRYAGFLIVSDEKALLMNRVAPVLPFSGAFVAACDWSFKKALIYTLVGGMLKYGLILGLSSVFFSYLSSDAATYVTLVLVLVVIVISISYSVVRKNRMQANKPNPPVESCTVKDK